MRRFLIVSLCTLALLAASRQSAEAASITFNLTCFITGGDCTTPAPAGSGSVTLTDNGNDIDIRVSVSTGLIQALWLNFKDLPLQSGYSFTSTNSTVSLDANNQKPGSYSLGFLDLQLPSSGNLGATSPFTTTLKLGNGSTFLNLDTAQFAVKSTDGALYAAVKGNNNGNEGFLGATTCDGCGSVQPLDATSAPEPTSMLLLGTGLAGLVVYRRRARRS